MDLGGSLISVKMECILILSSQDKGTGLSGSFVLPLTCAREPELDSVVIKPCLQSLFNLPECRQIFLLSHFRGRHFLGKTPDLTCLIAKVIML